MSDIPAKELEAVLAWLKSIEAEMGQLHPDSDGGDTGALCREAIETLELLIAVES